MKNLSKIIKIKEHNSDNCDISFIDVDFTSNTANLHKKNINISQTDKSQVKKKLIEKIINLSNKNNIINFSLVNDLKKYDDLLLEKQLKKTFDLASLLIATNGRIGKANVFLISKKNYEKLNLSKLKLEENYEMFFDDSINDIFLYRKNDINQPGLILVTNQDKYEFVEIGLKPETQFVKVSI